MPLIGVFHLAAAILAIASGAAVLLLTRKGGRRHRQLGWFYVGSMAAVNVTALLIYKLFGGFGPFHVAALVSLVTVGAGTLVAMTARRRRLARDAKGREHFVEAHYWWMTFSYVGLIAAFASEVITRHPGTRNALGGPGINFALAVGAATFLVVGVGATLIRARASASLAPHRARSDEGAGSRSR